MFSDIISAKWRITNKVQLLRRAPSYASVCLMRECSRHDWKTTSQAHSAYDGSIKIIFILYTGISIRLDMLILIFKFNCFDIEINLIVLNHRKVYLAKIKYLMDMVFVVNEPKYESLDKKNVMYKFLSLEDIGGHFYDNAPKWNNFSHWLHVLLWKSTRTGSNVGIQINKIISFHHSHGLKFIDKSSTYPRSRLLLLRQT